jgi:two-component system, NtrC family, C4-dicarboxylate transport sensor histidine kinase DctB
MIAIPRPLRLTFYSLLIIAGAVLAAALAMRQAERQSLVDDAGRANQQLSAVRQLAAHPDRTLPRPARRAGAGPGNDPRLARPAGSPRTQDVLNRKLERINGAAQSSTLELMDSTGLAVAASNWNTCQ